MTFGQKLFYNFFADYAIDFSDSFSQEICGGKRFLSGDLRAGGELRYDGGDKKVGGGLYKDD